MTTGVLKPIGVGVVGGLLGSLALARLFESFLYDMTPNRVATT